jgi:hypothetical protein
MKAFLIPVAAAVVLVTSCATVKQNIDARTFLAKCKYEYVGVKVTGVQFSSGIMIDRVDFDVRVKITDTTDRDVALDHADVAFFLDKNHVLDAAHKKFVRIAPQASSTETVSAGIPFGGVIKTLGHRPEIIGVKAKLWVTLLVGKDTWETPIVIPLEADFPIPWDQIDVYVAQKKKQMADDAAAKAKSALPSVKVPHL